MHEGADSDSRILLRYVLPIAVAVSLVAFVGVPYIDHVLAGWFRSDVELRAKLVMTSLEEPLGDLLEHGEIERARAYLTRVASDGRLLGVVVCDSSGGVYCRRIWSRRGAVPTEPPAEWRQHGNEGHIRSRRRVEFPAAPGRAQMYQVLLIHDLGFIDRRQTTARNFMLAIVVFAAVVLAILGGFGIRLLLNRWRRMLLGDMRSKRFLDDARSDRASSPVLSRVRDMLRELEANQRLEIEFRENWTPQALQQVVREQLDGCTMLVVSNREPYIHNHGSQDGRGSGAGQRHGDRH